MPHVLLKSVRTNEQRPTASLGRNGAMRPEQGVFLIGQGCKEGQPLKGRRPRCRDSIASASENLAAATVPSLQRPSGLWAMP